MIKEINKNQCDLNSAVMTRICCIVLFLFLAIRFIGIVISLIPLARLVYRINLLFLVTPLIIYSLLNTTFQHNH